MGGLVGGRTDGRLEEYKIRLTQPSLAGTGAELGKNACACGDFLSK